MHAGHLAGYQDVTVRNVRFGWKADIRAFRLSPAVLSEVRFLLGLSGMFAKLALTTAAFFGMAAPDTQARTLKTSELKALLRGSWITEADIPDPHNAASTARFFWATGRYTGEFDNYEAVGTYRIARNRVCMTELGEKPDCRAILVDVAGQYWMTTSAPGDLVHISVGKIVDRQ